MTRTFVLSTLLFLVGSPARADLAPFQHDILCQAHDTTAPNTSTSVRIVYNRNEFTDLGRPGGIHVELNTGVSELSYFSAALGLAKPFCRVVRRTGPAGQVGNWIAQDTKDPFIAQVKLGFTSYDVLDDKGHAVEKQVNSFISDLRLSRVKETGFHSGSNADTREFLELVLLDDLGIHHMKFDTSECLLLN